MKITPSLLADAVGCTPAIADRYAGPLTEACERFDINTPGRLAAFLANVGHESASLSKQRESMNYRSDKLVGVFGSHRITAEQAAKYGRTVTQPADQEAIANIVYGGAWGAKNLGNTEPGDGWRFRAAGPIGTTGRSNFRELRPALLLAGYEDVPDFEAEPERLTEPRWGAAAAGHFWHSRGLNKLADAGAFEAIVRRINGGLTGDADRRLRWSKALSAINLHAEAAAAPAAVSPDQAFSATAETTQPAEIVPPIVSPGGYMPAGEFIPETPMPIAPIIAAVLPSIIESIPKLGKLFGSGSEVAERNVKAAEMAVTIVQDAVGAVNAQDAAEKIKTDPTLAAAATAAVDAAWFQLSESGGGGIDGARKADAAARMAGDMLHSPSFWVAVALLPLVYMIVGSVIGLFGTPWSDDVRSAIANGVVGVVLGSLAGYYFGQSTSRNRS